MCFFAIRLVRKYMYVRGATQAGHGPSQGNPAATGVLLLGLFTSPRRQEAKRKEIHSQMGGAWSTYMNIHADIKRFSDQRSTGFTYGTFLVIFSGVCQTLLLSFPPLSRI